MLFGRNGFHREAGDERPANLSAPSNAARGVLATGARGAPPALSIREWPTTQPPYRATIPEFVRRRVPLRPKFRLQRT